MRKVLVLLTALGSSIAPATAAAQAECPPGGWFCDEAEAEESAESANAADSSEEADGDAADAEQAPAKEPPKVVVVTPKASDTKIVVTGPETEPPPPSKPASRSLMRGGDWGFNLRIEGVLLGDDHGRADDSGMGGLGFSFRYRPVPAFAFDAGLDFVGGRDWNGDPRAETALLLSGIMFINPDDPVQVYALGGFGFSKAEVELRRSEMVGGEEVEIEDSRDYSYFGGHLGAGLEFRVGRMTALNLDLVGFIRGRTDDLAQHEPEFVDPDDPGRTTNTSGGGLLRGGVTFYW